MPHSALYNIYHWQTFRAVVRACVSRLMGFIENYERVKREVEAAALSCGRDPSRIHIVAVSKSFDAGVVQKAIDGGIRIFGENRVQEAKQKIPLLKGDFVFHMVGHLQSNKARDAVRLFDLIHSIDKLSTAKAVADEAARANKRQKVLIQVNTSGEDTKSGVSPDESIELARGVTALPTLDLLGVMTIGPLTDDEAAIRKSFIMARTIMHDINQTLGLSLTELSMGMSGDFRIAVEEGATLLRIGTAIFGEREVK